MPSAKERLKAIAWAACVACVAIQICAPYASGFAVRVSETCAMHAHARTRTAVVACCRVGKDMVEPTNNAYYVTYAVIAQNM